MMKFPTALVGNSGYAPASEASSRQSQDGGEIVYRVEDEPGDRSGLLEGNWERPGNLQLKDMRTCKLAYHYLSRNSEDEWVISRVFRKNGSGTSSAAGGGKKRSSDGIPEANSPSSATLPPLLEPSAADFDGSKEHVPCFSTTAPTSLGHNSIFEFPPPPSSLSAVVYDPSSTSHFPSMRSLQENLHRPLFFSADGPPPMHDSAEEMFSFNSPNQWPAAENQKICPDDQLDCMWSC
ncbi:hypothetical protein DH2020_008609 [Rehmannia glutinosa]|uniref:NAC domain-containing protein n=1 Tax=Rehmannia glutinosa TaxID=99300 RepID=A0ABR0X576_REHGL